MTPAASPVIPNALKGILLVLGATFAFALADAAGKHLFMRLPVPFVQAVRYVLNVVLLFIIFWPRSRQGLWKTQRTILVLVRGLALAMASLTMGFALRLMPLGETISILHLSPFAVMLLAIPLLGEKVGPAAWFGAFAGFAGVLLIVRPGGGLDPVGVAWALTNASLATAYHLLTRFLARTESMNAMVFHTALVGAIVFCLLSIGNLPQEMPAMLDWLLMATLGVTATVGHILFTMAYREAPASLLAPVNYMHLAWAAGLGWLIFDHLPDALTMTGMALIAGSGVAVALRAHFEKQAQKRRAS